MAPEGRADDGQRLGLQRTVAIRPGQPIDGVFEHTRNAAVVLRRDHQHRIGVAGRGSQCGDRRRRTCRVEILVVKREIIEGTDILFYRELTGGLYFGPSGLEELPDGQQRAYSTAVYTTSEVERIVRMAASAAQKRRNKLTMVDKANVLEASRLWRRVSARIMKEEFPSIEYDVVLVDSMAMHLLSRPTSFDVVVTSNMFGDILTDEASMLPGSLGMLPSASLGSDGPGLYEPIHGSAPDIAGKGIANPLATILASAMLLRHSLGLESEAAAVESAVKAVLAAGHRTADLVRKGQPSLGTVAITEHVLTALSV
jgi:3-isopropylmalate dehydrogenase